MSKLTKSLGLFGCAVALTAACATPALALDGVTTMATSAPLNMRSEADINSSVITTIPQGTSVQVFGMTNSGWYDVEHNGQRGNCWYRYLDFEGTTDGTVHDGHYTDMYATTGLNVRAEPNTDSAIIGSLSTGDCVAVTAKNDGWFTVNFNGTTGYCYGRWLDFGQTGDQCQATSAPASVMNTLTTSVNLNVRQGPSESSAVIGMYKTGEQVKVTGSVADGIWYQVDYNGQTAYVVAKWLQ